MDPSLRARVYYDLLDLDQTNQLVDAGVRWGDVIVDRTNPTTQYHIFDGYHPVLVDPTTIEFPENLRFPVPEELPPRYWSDILPLKREIPTLLRLSTISPDFYIVDEPYDNNRFFVVPFLNVDDVTQATENNVYYFMSRIDEDENEELSIYDQSTILGEDLGGGVMRTRWSERDIGGISADRIMLRGDD